jgi:hypothetical protein
MSKFDESFERESAKAIQIGIENVEIIQQATNWCKHFRFEMQSAGLLAQMSGLPIGMIEVSCQYTSEYPAGMNLPWIVPSFILKNCVACPHHESNGDVQWAEELIKNHERKVLEHNRSEQIRQEQLSAIRERLRELPRQVKDNARLDERQILTYIEELFSEDEDRREEIATLLIQAARIGADLFHSTAINILTEQALSEDFVSKCLPICVNLAQHREDLSPRFKDVAFVIIDRGIHLELAAEILIHLGQTVEYPLQSKQIHNLIGQQIHRRLIGGWHNSHPSYLNITNILVCCYDADSSSIIEQFQLFLKKDEKDVRVDACGALNLLQDIRPQIGIDLLAELITSLDLYDDIYNDSADAKAKDCIAKVLCYAPSKIDEYLVSVIYQKRPAVQEEIIDIYRRVFQNCSRDSNEKVNKLTKIRAEEQLSVTRCLEFVKDGLFDLEVRHKAAECLESICYSCPRSVMSNFDTLLGYYALICTQDEPTNPPLKIILLGVKPQDPRIAPLDSYNRSQKWQSFKNKLIKSLQKLIEFNSEATGQIVISCYKNLDSKAHEQFKSTLLKMLGYVGKEYSFRSQVLPLIMDGLMNFESQIIRASAIRAIEEMYHSSLSDPPKNIIDVLIVHLRDNYVIVHQAVIQILCRRSSWFDREQAAEALNLMISWLYNYKTKPYDLDDIARAIINIARRFTDLKDIALQHITAVLPTNEEIVDLNIVEYLIGFIDPKEPNAVILASQIGWCLAKYERDRYNSYESSKRFQMFKWLHYLPKNTYKSIQPDLFESAKQLAVKDAWEACYFASIFTINNDYSAEKEILMICEKSLESEKRYSDFQSELQLLALIANINSCLKDGNLNKANSLLAE